MISVRNILTVVLVVAALAAPASAASKPGEPAPAVRGAIKAIDGEAVSLDCGTADGVSLKMEFSVFSPAKVVKLPFTGRNILIREKKIATLLVTAVKPESCKARVLWKEKDSELTPGLSVASVLKELERRPNAPPDVKLVVESKDIYSGAQVPVRVDVSDLDDKSHFFKWSCSDGYFRMLETVEPRNIWTPPAAPGKYTLQIEATDPKGAKGTDSLSVESTGMLKAPRINMGPSGGFGFESRRFGRAGDLVFGDDGSLILLDTANLCLVRLSADFRVQRVGVKFGSDQCFARVAIRNGVISAIDPESYSGGIFEHKDSLDLTASRHSFGSYGEVNGKFLQPADLVITKNGETVVLDRKAKRFQVFSPEGRFAISVAEAGEQNARLLDPAGLCLDSTDCLYVLDAGNRKVQRYVSFKLEREFPLKEADIKQPLAIAYNSRTRTLNLLDGADGSVKSYSLAGDIQPLDFNPAKNPLGVPENPTQIHCDVFGNIYITAQEETAVLKYAWNGTFLGKWGGEETRRATRVAAGPKGEMFLLAPATGWMFSDETRNCIWKLDHNGWIVWRLGIPGKEAAFKEATDLVCGPQGNLFVLDVGANQVLRFAPDGTLVGPVGDGKFESPIDIAAGPDGFAVLEYKLRESVHVFRYDGTPAGAPFPPQQGDVETYKPHRIACGPGGAVYVYSRSDHAIQAFNADGTVAANWKNSYDTVIDDLAATPTGLLFIPESAGISAIAPKRPELQRLKFAELVTRPLDIATDPLGRVYVLNEEPRRVIVFRFWK